MVRVILFLLVSLALLTAPVLAQQPPTMTSLAISLWPEYDKPALLVIYRGQFAADSSLPLAVEFRIPAEAGQPQAVAYLDQQGQPLTLEYTTRTEGDWLVVSFELPTQGFQLEYYAPLPGSPAPGQRSFTYTYSADYPVTALNLEVQEPLSSQGFKLEPPADSVIQGADGLNYHMSTVGPLKQGDTATWSVSYEKTDSGLSVGASVSEPTEAPAAVSSTASGENKGVSGILIAAVSLIILVAVGVGAYWLGKRAQPVSTPAAPSKRRRGGQKGRPAQSTTQDSSFCYKCGARLRSDADFCHQCGAAVRKS